VDTGCPGFDRTIRSGRKQPICQSMAAGRLQPSRQVRYFSSSRSTRATSASTNRQSTATVMSTRIRDDLSSKGLTSLAFHPSERARPGTPVGTARGPLTRFASRWPDLPDQSARYRFALRREVSPGYACGSRQDRLPIVGEGGLWGCCLRVIIPGYPRTARDLV